MREREPEFKKYIIVKKKLPQHEFHSQKEFFKVKKGEN